MNTMILLSEKLRRAFRSEDGIGTVEMILVLFVLIGVVIIFKQNIEDLVNSYFNNMDPGFTH